MVLRWLMGCDVAVEYNRVCVGFRTVSFADMALSSLYKRAICQFKLHRQVNDQCAQRSDGGEGQAFFIIDKSTVAAGQQLGAILRFVAPMN